MATKSEELLESERIREVIRQLSTAIKQCHKLLGAAERAVQATNQDNDPPRPIPDRG